MAKKVEEVKVEETKVEVEETKIASAKEAGKNFGKKVVGFGKKALPIAAAFGAGVGAMLIAGALSKKSSSSADGSEAVADDASWDETLESVSEE